MITMVMYAKIRRMHFREHLSISEIQRRTSFAFLLGVLNSNLMNHFFRLMFPANNHIASNQLASLPVPAAAAKEQERMAALVEALIMAETARASAVGEDQRASLDERCRALEEKIEEMVATLFGVAAVE